MRFGTTLLLPIPRVFDRAARPLARFPRAASPLRPCRSFNPNCWPDVPGMVQQLNDMGIELATTFWPYVTPSGAYYSNFSSAGYFVKNLTTGVEAPVETWAGQMFLTDETSAAARAAIYQAFVKGYGQFGIRTVWCVQFGGKQGGGRWLCGIFDGDRCRAGAVSYVFASVCWRDAR